MREAAEFSAPIASEIWNLKYRLKAADGAPVDMTLTDTFRRVAAAAASVEKGGKRAREAWADRFFNAIADMGFLPGGRILAGAGSGRVVTLFNCFVMGPIADDLGAIFESVREAALTLQQGGGIGHDFSTLRPKGALVKSIGADASGPVSFMDVWDAMCRTIMSAGARRGAMMGVMRCDHPDIEEFIGAKADARRLRNFNLSVLVTDAFMAAVREDRPWDLVFSGKIYRTLPARALWQRIMRAAYDTAEPGVIFIDRINQRNNLAYCEFISATNPCGEQPLPPYGACLLGSLNLTRFVSAPFTPDARLDVSALAARAGLAVRLLDNMIGLSNYPLPQQRKEALAKRRIGLGVTGLADALIMLGLRYGSDAAAAETGQWMAAIQNAAYRASAELAAEKGAFPLYDAERFLAAPNIVRLDADVRALIGRHGIRNGCLTSIAPTGTISLLAGNVSSGVEPVFDEAFTRRVLLPDGSHREERVEDYAFAVYRRLKGASEPLSPHFVTAAELAPAEHLAMQAALQPHVDSAISKTINCAADIGFDAFKGIYEDAYNRDLKGCTAFRPNAVTGSVLVASEGGHEEPPEAASNVEARGEAVAPMGAGRAPVPATRDASVVYMSKPLERDTALAGFTYKIKWPESDHAIYVTINDIEQGGRRRPFEIFINTRNLEHYAWTVALTRMISAVFRRGGDVSFVAEELKAVFDPQGGRWMGGRYVPSLLAAIGDVIEEHMLRIGFVQPGGLREGDRQHGAPEHPPLLLREASGQSGPGEEASGDPGLPQKRPTGASARQGGARAAGGKSCPRCAAQSFVRDGSCWVCRSCGFSRCS